MTIDYEPGGSTMIRVSWKAKEELNALKIVPREAIGDVVQRLIKENQTFHKIYGTTQTKEKMEKDLKNFVLNPAIPDTGPHHRDIWLQAHPGECLTQEDVIHHINGNHDDNRIENLQKVTTAEHGKLHIELNKNNA